MAEHLRAAQEEGMLRGDVDCAAEAAALVALVDGVAVQASFEPRRFAAASQLALVEARLAELRA